MQFSYYKTANRTALRDAVRCSAMQYYLRCGAVMSFCERFWYGFYDLYGLCGLVNNPNCTWQHRILILPKASTLSGAKATNLIL